METPSRDRSPSLPGVVAGRYRPIRVVATGGMSTVYEVEHQHTGERLALKVLKQSLDELDPTSLERFRREARISSQLKSEHLVRVIDADVASELGGSPYLVFDLLEGSDLAGAAGTDPQAPEVVVGWLRQVARVLDQAHALGIIHRDLKPENLFLERRPDGSEIVKVLDFGIAKLRSLGTQDSGRTATGAVLGTPLYMAPEQASGENESIGPATDVWAVGLLAYRLLSGEDYWKATNVALLLADIIYSPMKPPSARSRFIGVEVDAWFARSCDRDPAKRFQNAGEQVEALAEALAVGPAPPRAVSGLALAETHAEPPSQGRPSAVDPDSLGTGNVARTQSTTAVRPAWRRPAVIGVAALAVAALTVFGSRVPTKEADGGPPAKPAKEIAIAVLPTPVAASPGAAHPAPPMPSVNVASATSITPAAPRAAATGSSPRHGVPRRPPRPNPPPRQDPLADPK